MDTYHFTSETPDLAGCFLPARDSPRRRWYPCRIRWRLIHVVVVSTSVANCMVSVASVIMAAIHHHYFLHHPVVPLILTLHGVGQVAAMVGVAVYSDVTAQLRHNLHQARLRQQGKRRNKVSCLITKEKNVYGSQSIDNLREKTGDLIPLEKEVTAGNWAWFYITCKMFTYLSLASLLPLSTVGSVIVYDLWTRPTTNKDCQSLLLFSLSLFSVYSLLYLAVFLFKFCKTSCLPLWAKRENSITQPDKVKLSPQFENIAKYSPGWEWVCFMCCWVWVAELALALPSLVVGASYLSLCPYYLLTPAWLTTQGVAVVVSVVVLAPLHRLLHLQPYYPLLTLLRLLTGALTLFLLVWPAVGVPWAVSAWKERATISSSSGGTCDTSFLLYTLVVVAVFALPLLTLVFVLVLYLTAVALVGVGTMLYWCYCDDSISSDVGVITDSTYARSPIMDPHDQSHVTSNTLNNGSINKFSRR